MFIRGSDRVEQVQGPGNLLVIRCEGMLNGRRCGALIDLPLHEKAVCEHCGWVSPPWTGYSSAHRTITKNLCDLPCIQAEPDTPSPAPLPSSP